MSHSKTDKSDLNSSMESLLQFERQLFQKAKHSKPVVTSKATALSSTSSTLSSPRKRKTLEDSSTLKIMRSGGQSSTAFASSSGTSNPNFSPVIPSTVFKAPNVSSTFSSTKPIMSSKISNHHATIIGASSGTPIGKGISEPTVTIPPNVPNLPATNRAATTTSKHLPKPSNKQSSTTEQAYKLFRSANILKAIFVPIKTEDSSSTNQIDNNEISNLMIKQEPEEESNNQPVTQSDAQQICSSSPSHQESGPETMSFPLTDLKIEDLSRLLGESETFTISKVDLMELLQASRKSTIRESEPSSPPKPVQPLFPYTSSASMSNFNIFITFSQIDHYLMSYHDENNRPQFDLFVAELSQILLVDRKLTCPIGNVYVHGPMDILVRVFNQTSLVKMFTDKSVYLCKVRHSNGENSNKENSVDVYFRLKPETSFM